MADQLGAGFISLNQLPPAVRRDLGDDALAALTLRADRNVHPVTVAPQGDVAMALNRMAVSDPEAFAEDLRLYRDRVSPAEMATRWTGRRRRGWASFQQLNARREEFEKAKQAWKADRTMPQAFISPLQAIFRI